jgi:pilus assembly protein CpaB
MRMKSLILIFIALGCGLVASIGISQVMDRGGSGGSMEMEQILVALADIDISSKLDDKNVQLEDWPKNKVPEGAIRRLDDVKDKFALKRFVKGEPIHTSKITDNPNSKSSTIPAGYRAMPVKVDEDTVMKAITPGDRVDVMVFLKKDKAQGIPETTALTILKNVRVFAVNTNTDRSGETGGGKEATMFRTVSLLLKPEHSRELAVAARIGKIVLTLRGPEETDAPDGGEQVASLANILRGGGSTVSPAVAPGSASPFSSVNDGPIGAVDPVPLSGPAVAWRMTISSPAGVDQFEWTDREKLPSKSEGIPGLPTFESTEDPSSPTPSDAPSFTPTSETPPDENN